MGLATRDYGSLRANGRCRMATREETVYSKVQNTLLAATGEGSSLESRQEECVQRFTDLGLGRGVDATSSKPWLEKSSFQVRRVTFDSLLGTEEGGAVEAYDSLVSSVQTLQLSMKASVMAPTNAGHVKIGIEGEHSRTISSSRRVVGRRVQNRTIAFIEALDDAPFCCRSCDTEEEHQASPKATPSQRWPTFEDRLSLWVLERLESEHPVLGAAKHLAAVHQGTSPTHAFDEWYQEAAGSDGCRRVRYFHTCLANLCYSFVASLHVTHYVFSIQLGAVEYSVMSEQEYYRTLSQSSTLGLETVVNMGLSMSGKHTRKRQTKTSTTKKIGSIQSSSDKGPFCVPRGTYAEAVIGAEFKPITTLVHHPHLRRALRIATSMYINKQCDSSGGLLFLALPVMASLPDVLPLPSSCSGSVPALCRWQDGRDGLPGGGRCQYVCAGHPQPCPGLGLLCHHVRRAGLRLPPHLPARLQHRRSEEEERHRPLLRLTGCSTPPSLLPDHAPLHTGLEHTPSADDAQPQTH